MDESEKAQLQSVGKIRIPRNMSVLSAQYLIEQKIIWAVKSEFQLMLDSRSISVIQSHVESTSNFCETNSSNQSQPRQMSVISITPKGESV